jgi:hypothetical protein
VRGSLQNRASGQIKAQCAQEGFGDDLKAFATCVVELRGTRHDADHDPMIGASTLDARIAVTTAGAAVARFEHASPARRRAVILLLLFQPRWMCRRIAVRGPMCFPSTNPRMDAARRSV